MSYEPKGFSWLADSYKARLARRSAEHLRSIAEKYTDETEGVSKLRATAKKLDKQAQNLEDKLKKKVIP